MKRIISIISMLTAVMCLDMEAKVSLPSILSDGMVLQRDKPICIWGNADRRVTDMFADEISAYEESRIRQYSVPQVYDFNSPQEDTPASSWKPCTQENVMEFSALAYFSPRKYSDRTVSLSAL
jgi:hypothetical protein